MSFGGVLPWLAAAAWQRRRAGTDSRGSPGSP